MIITDIKTFVVDCYRTNWVFLKIYTDTGITGVGEATLEYKEHAVVGAVEDIRYYLMGKDPRNIEALFYEIYRSSYWRTGPVLNSALSGVEMALWDILGKSLNVPVYQLLGGKIRNEIKIYANGWFAGSREADEFAFCAKTAKEHGLQALKWDPFGKSYMSLSNRELNRSIQCVAAVREAVGDDVDLLIEGHGRFNVKTALRIACEIAPFKPMFFEEPCPPDNIEPLIYVAEHSSVPIACGERIFTIYDFMALLEKGAIQYLQPDASHAGGIMNLKKIAAMAEAKHVAFAPHNPSGPVANAACLQLAACTSNFEILETMITDIPWRLEVTNENLTFSNGCVTIPDAPGLGIELDEGACERHPFSPKYLRHYNGTLTDIRPQNSEVIYFYNGMDLKI